MEVVSTLSIDTDYSFKATFDIFLLVKPNFSNLTAETLNSGIFA